MKIIEEDSVESEEWRDIEGYEGLYQVSSLGRIRSLTRICKVGKGLRKLDGRVLKQYKYLGYMVLVLYDKKANKKICRVHRAVAKAFVAGDTSLVVNHKDGVRHNNHVDNLEWVTQKENIRHASTFLRKGAIIDGRPYNAKLDWAQVLTICSLKSYTTKKLSKHFSIPTSSIRRIRNGQAYKFITECIFQNSNDRRMAHD